MMFRIPIWKGGLFQFRLLTLLLLVFVAAISIMWYVNSSTRLLGLEGFCPVSLIEKQAWRRGKPQFSAIYEGRKYLFFSQTERDQFDLSPARYAPLLAGADVVRLIDDKRFESGKRAHGIIYQGHIYLFDSDATLEKFWAKPAHYAQLAANQAVASN